MVDESTTRKVIKNKKARVFQNKGRQAVAILRIGSVEYFWTNQKDGYVKANFKDFTEYLNEIAMMEGSGFKELRTQEPVEAI